MAHMQCSNNNENTARYMYGGAILSQEYATLSCRLALLHINPFAFTNTYVHHFCAVNIAMYY